jgi:hypothetical protein
MSSDKIGAYFRHHATELSRQAQHIGEMFAAHRPSSGSNKEQEIRKFFAEHLSGNIGVGTGLIASEETIATEQDVILYDRNSNSPLHGEGSKSIFLIETIYGLIECKSHLGRDEFLNSVEKFTKIDRLPRNLVSELGPKIDDTLYCIFAFSGPDPETLVKYYEQAFARDGARVPDFIVVPNRYIVVGGKYRILAGFGKEGSGMRDDANAPLGNLQRFFDLYSAGDETLFIFFHYLQKWLWTAGSRKPNLLAYRPTDKVYGNYETYELKWSPTKTSP